MMENRLFRIRGQSDRRQRYKRYKGQARRIDAQPLIYTKKRESSKKGKRGFPLGAVKCYFLNGRPTAALSLPSLAYRLAQGEPMNRPLGCSLNGSPHHSTDDPLLGEDVNDEDRSHGHQVGREGHRIVRRELALEHILCERNRLIALISQRDQRQ